ncbi:transposase [Methanosarcina hadiensis]|uniref:transposase n=1 Tax=Methanosarcina hadiensis TaxID=3078083 RepID=UPI003977AD3C
MPTYRYDIFYSKQIEKDCDLIFNNICNYQGYKLYALENIDDQVHLFAEFYSTNSLSKIVRYLGGESSYGLFKLILN